MPELPAPPGRPPGAASTAVLLRRAQEGDALEIFAHVGMVGELGGDLAKLLFMLKKRLGDSRLELRTAQLADCGNGYFV